MTAPQPDREQEIRSRAGAATRGPWCTDGAEIYQGTEYMPGISEWIGEMCRADDRDGGKADAEFAAHARADISWLLGAIDNLRAMYDGASAGEDRQLDERDHLLSRVAELEQALAAAGRSLSSFIFDSEDPGTAALGAQWLYHQAMPQADDPFAQPRAYRASVFEEAARAAEEIATAPANQQRPQAYLDGFTDGANEVAERLEKMADEAAEGRDIRPDHDAAVAAAARRALEDAAKRQREFVLSDDFVCDDWEAALTVVDLIDPAVASPAGEQGEEARGTLPAWLYQRFGKYPIGVDWGELPETDQEYWAHEASAVRRAVAQGGFKTPEAGEAR